MSLSENTDRDPLVIIEFNMSHLLARYKKCDGRERDKLSRVGDSGLGTIYRGAFCP